MRKKFSRCILHIGCEKTGTSTIQRFLAVNRSRFRKEGVLYPEAGGSRHGGSQIGYAILAKANVWATKLGQSMGIDTPGKAAKYLQDLGEDFERQIKRAKTGTTLVLSSEHFHSRLPSVEEVRKLWSFLEPHVEKFQVVVYFRRQDRVAVSLFCTHVKSGNPNPRPFLPALDLPETYYYRYDEVFQNWCSVFGEEAMIPAIFHSSELLNGDVLQDFCHRAGLGFAGKLPVEIQNPSIDPQATAFLIQANRFLRSHSGKLEELDRLNLIRELEKLRPGNTYPIDRATAREFFLRFAEGNQRLKTVAFRGRRQPIFDRDFSKFPEKLPPLPRSYPHAVLIGLQLSRSLQQQIQSIQG